MHFHDDSQATSCIYSTENVSEYCKTRLDWICETWTGFVKHGFVKGRFAKHGFVKYGFVKGGFVKHGFVIFTELHENSGYSNASRRYLVRDGSLKEATISFLAQSPIFSRANSK